MFTVSYVNDSANKASLIKLQNMANYKAHTFSFRWLSSLPVHGTNWPLNWCKRSVRRITVITEEPTESMLLFQQFSIALQRCNVVALLWTFNTEYMPVALQYLQASSFVLVCHNNSNNNIPTTIFIVLSLAVTAWLFGRRCMPLELHNFWSS